MAYTAPIAAAQQTQAIVSSLDTMLKPQVYNKVFSRFPDQTELGWMMAEGMFEKVNGQSVSWHEQNKIIGSNYVGAFAQIGATNGVRITLGAGSYQNSGVYSYARVNNQVEFPGSLLQGVVKAKSETTPNGHTIDVYPLNTDLIYSDFVAGLTVGTRFSAFALMGGEGSSGPVQGLTATTSVFSAQLQKFEDMYEGTFETITNQTYPDPISGKAISWVYGASQIETEDRFRMGIEMACFLGVQNSGATQLTDAAGLPTNTTQGYWKTLAARGSQMTYPGDFTMAQFDQLRLINKNNQCGKKFKMLMGFEFGTTAKNMLKELGEGGSIVYSNSNSEKIVDFSFSKLIIQGWEYDMKDLNILSHPDLAGIPGNPYSGSCIVTPMDMVKDTKTGKGMKPFAIVYKDQSGIGSNQVARDWYSMGQTGFYAANGPTNTKKSQRLDFVADCGARTVNAITHVLITKTY